MEHAGYADANCRDEHHGHDHSATFSTWSYESSQPLSLEALREAARKLPGNIYRAKGVVYTSDAPDRRVVLQVVGRRVDISMQDEWDGRMPRTQIVAHRRGRQCRSEADGRDLHFLHLGRCRGQSRVIKVR